jgi:organic radical activating enzyme
MSQWYCPLPFRHAYIDSTGVGACCHTPRYPISVTDWTLHPELKKLQQQLLTGKPPQQCQACVQSESLKGTSLRTDALKDYDHEIFQDTKIDFVDFRSYNICNFKCRSCNPQFSHGINQEINRHPELKSFFYKTVDGKTASVSEENIEWIINNLSTLKKIMLTGGEPTYIPAVRELINQIKLKHTHVQVLITSNASFQDEFWFEITRHLPNLHWTISIDAVGEHAKIVRHGSDWNQIQKNAEWLAQHAQSLDVNSVISNLNVFDLKSLLKFGRRLQHLSTSPSGRHGDLGCRHQFYVCQRPYYLTADNWPDDYKPRVIDHLESCLELDLDHEQNQMLVGLLHKIKNSQFDSALWNRTQKYNQILNDIRHENHLELYKEQV